MSFLNSSENNNDSNFNAGGIADGLVKSGSELLFQEAEGPREEALAALGSFGAQAVTDFFFGEDKNIIPEQYTGNTDIDIQEKQFWDTYNFVNKNLFSDTVVENKVQYQKNHPMTKSMFLVDFEFNKNIVNDSRLNVTYPKSMSFLLKSMTMPKATIETEKIPAYNVRKTFPSRITYEPVTCTFGDIYTAYRSENSMISLLDLYQQYMSYYFNDFVKDNDNNLHHGFASGRDEKYFIENISIYFFWADGSRKIRLRNPFIKEFDYQDLDYTTDEQMTVSTSIEYEYLDMHELNMTFDQFLDAAEHLLNDVNSNLKDNSLSNPFTNLEALQPGLSPNDDQRSANLDNPLAQTALSLFEVEGVNFASDYLGSDNPLISNAANSVVGGSVGVAGNVLGAATDATSGLL